MLSWKNESETQLWDNLIGSCLKSSSIVSHRTSSVYHLAEFHNPGLGGIRHRKMAQSNVFFYVPNIIGYVRILLLGCSFYYIFDSHRLALLLYGASYSMDAIDGLAARLLNQSSLFGSILDMLTDRVSTMCLLMTLGHLYSSQFLTFQLLLAIDIVSHWLHFFSANIQGKTSHKSSDGETNYATRLYYENKLVLTSVCAMEQIFYCSLVVCYYEYQNMTAYLIWLTVLCIPALVFKNYINLLQIYGACKVMGSIDNAHLYHAS